MPLRATFGNSLQPSYLDYRIVFAAQNLFLSTPWSTQRAARAPKQFDLAPGFLVGSRSLYHSSPNNGNLDLFTRDCFFIGIPYAC